MFSFKYPENFPIKLKNVEYFSEIKDGENVYLNWRDGKIEQSIFYKIWRIRMNEKDKKAIDTVKGTVVTGTAVIGGVKGCQKYLTNKDEKHANTDYSKFGGLKHFIYAGY